jgi:hypothetical protein
MDTKNRYIVKLRGFVSQSEILNSKFNNYSVQNKIRDLRTILDVIRSHDINGLSVL